MPYCSNRWGRRRLEVVLRNAMFAVSSSWAVGEPPYKQIRGNVRKASSLHEAFAEFLLGPRYCART